MGEPNEAPPSTRPSTLSLVGRFTWPLGLSSRPSAAPGGDLATATTPNACCALHRACWKNEPEAAAAAHHRVEFHVATQCVRQLAGDRQAEARSLRVAGHERPEDPLLQLGCYARAA